MNERHRGAAGAWNTGLAWLNARRFNGYVAILDDDDEWDADHLESCAKASDAGHADVVISGLRFIKDGVEQFREPLHSISRDDFLAGNPGWQGSNTFVRSRTLQRVGGFTDGLPSTNDRDLAVRLLGLPDLSVAFTGRMTASWHLRSESDSVSRPGSPEKRAGLRQFFQMHGHLMSLKVEARFRQRARDLFEVEVP
jgi:glycosyltransferase involved in cell wall biosynthesis